MRTLSFLVCASVASCSATSAGRAQDDTESNRLSLYLGQRALDEDDYEPVDKQGVLGVEFAKETPSSPVGFEFGAMLSGDSSTVAGENVDGATGELYGGVRKGFGSGVVRPLVGAGLSVIAAAIDVPSADDDWSLAGYVHAGVGFALGATVMLGLDVRFLFGSKLELAGVSTDADYGQAALFLAFNL